MIQEVDLLHRGQSEDGLKEHVSTPSPFHQILTVMRHHP